MQLLLMVIVVSVAGVGTQHPAMPKGMSHEEHRKQMAAEKQDALKHRGADAMGFDQDATVHHFRLSATGGSIEVTAKASTASELIEAVRTHLKTIAGDFSRGDFDKPFKTHAEMPPGVEVMKKRARVIAYTFELVPQGAAVWIRTTDQRAIRAIHDFLRYQIKEHQTGDPLVISR